MIFEWLIRRLLKTALSFDATSGERIRDVAIMLAARREIEKRIKQKTWEKVGMN